MTAPGDGQRVLPPERLAQDLHDEVPGVALVQDPRDDLAERAGALSRREAPAPSPPLPARPQSLNELVYAELRRQILWGEIAAGSTLSVRRLSERFRVSPMPVRDAIRRLEVEDLVEVTPRSATRVSLVSPEAVREIAEVRSRLEALAARLAVPNLTSADVPRLRELLRAMQQAAARNDPEAWHQGNAEFHRVVVHRSGNRLLTRMTDGLWDWSIRHFSARVPSQAHFRGLRHKEHQRIVQAIVNRDPDEVEQVWRDHVYQSGRETVDYLRALAMSTVPAAGRRGPGHDARTVRPTGRAARRASATSRPAVIPLTTRR
jgi:DNA-binding GntR family transcriptional regulator